MATTKRDLTVASLNVPPGEIGFGALEVAYLQDNSPVQVPIIAINGARPGPTLWVDSTMHGPEIAGAEVIRRLTREVLDPATLHGAVIAAPIVNPMAFRAQTMNTPQDEYNLNRVFPGNPHGLTSQRLAYQILNDGVLKADYAINFHANPLPAIMFSIVRSGDDEVSRKARDMADAFGITTINLRIQNEAHRTGTVSDAAAEHGIPMLVIEMIPWRRLDETSIRAGLRGTLNVMRHLGMIDGAVEPQSDVPVIPGKLTRTEVTADKGGLAHFMQEAGDPVKKGETIVVLRNPYGDVVEEITSPVDGWILAFPLMFNQAAVTGDFVSFIAYAL